MRVKALLFVLPLLCASLSFAQYGGELHFCLHSDPKTFDPLLVDDDASETVRYLTGGVLVRVNRLTQQIQPELATEWKLSNGARLSASSFVMEYVTPTVVPLRPRMSPIPSKS